MRDLLNALPDHTIRLFADCIPVKGMTRIAICDLTRNEIVFIPEEYGEVLEYVVSDTVSNVLGGLECEEEKEQVLEFIDFLAENELIALQENPDLFPPLNETWDFPGVIQNAIIDVKHTWHDFDQLFRELSVLGCMFVQIRSFSLLPDLEKLSRILKMADATSIESIELLFPYDSEIPDEKYKHFVENHPQLASLILHSAPANRELIADFGGETEAVKYIAKTIQLTTQIIDSASHCGVITPQQLSAPAMGIFFENKLHNGCLNRKISVDDNGEIKNCPSMKRSFGNVQQTSLIQVASNPDFQQMWHIRKDEITVCSVCEFRYVCTDCRAFLQNPEDRFSKPLKCGYDPYSGKWSEETTVAIRPSDAASIMD